jgi:predicted nucleic acid-binding protein
VIILDTNVVSEAMEIMQSPDDLYVTVITIVELRLRVEQLPTGRRRDDLENRVEGVLRSFGPDFVTFGVAAASHCAELLARRPSADLFDLQIAAIAIAQGATIATRNEKHFKGLGVDLVNPWSG